MRGILRRFGPTVVGAAAVLWLGATAPYLSPNIGPYLGLACLAGAAAIGWRAARRHSEDRRTAETALQAAEDRFRNLIETANEGVWLVDLEGRTMYVNAPMAAMLGYAPEEMMGRTAAGFCLPEDADSARRHLGANLAGKREQFDFRFRRKDGSPVLVLACTSPVYAAGGKVTGALGMFSDIGERRRAEEALRESEARFRQFAENTDGVFWMCDPAASKVLYVSPAYEQIWGRSTESLYENFTAWLEAIHPDDRRRVESAFFSGAAEGRYDEEYRIRRPDGVELWIRDRGYPVRDDAGEVYRIVGRAENITPRKRAETALRESEAKWRALLESAPQGVLATDATGRIALVNAKTEEMFGYERGELIGQSLEMLLPEGLRDAHRQHRADYYRHPRSRPMGVGLDLWARRRDGKQFPVEISLSYVGEGGAGMALALITDITERKRFDEKLRETAKLESLGVLAGGIAHDFNNLLTGILGNASLALDELPAHSPTRRLIEGVVRSSERAAHLTGQMLAYSGKGRFVVQLVDVSEFLRGTLDLLRSSVHRTVHLDAQLAGNLPSVEADVAQLQQLVMNLVINGAEAIGEQPGTVTVRTGLRQVGEGEHQELACGRYVFLEVRDTGCGMDETTRSRIFEPFYTTKFTGRGLGLAAALGIVRGHKAAIAVDSAPGSGSTFTVLFPAAEGAARPAAPEVQASPDSRGAILLVDDEEIVRQTAQRALEAHGYSVIVAENGRRAVELFERLGDGIFLVLLDLTMPVLSGEETFHRLKQVRRDVPIILSSGFSELEAVRRFDGMDLAGFLQKPYTATQLAEKVRLVCAAPR